MTYEDEKKVNEIVDKLTERIQSSEFEDYQYKTFVGVRSRQVVALIALLVEKGIL